MSALGQPRPVQYQHPSQGHTWSGRGRKPRWVEIWLGDGNSLDELRSVPRAAETDTTEPDHAVVALPSLVRLDDLYPSPTNPRKSFDAETLTEMADSIRRHGVLQAILVRPWPVEYPVEGHPPRYEIVAGERRYRAANLAGIDHIPATVRNLTDDEVLEIQIIENLQREAVHPMEEAEGYALLMQRGHHSAEELADKIGKSKAYVYARLKLTALCDAAREAFREGKLTASTALLVARIPGVALQAQYLDDIINGYNGPMAYRDAARVAQMRYMLRLAEAPFDVNVADLLPEAVDCGRCPKRSGNQPELFADVSSADVCTDPECFAAKREAWAARQRADAEAAGRTIITGKEAEAIVPPWASQPTTRRESGYLALDTPCQEARHLAIPIEDVAPVEPEPPDDDDDAAAEAAYVEAMRVYEDAMEAYEEREEAAIPTYRQLLADANVPTVMVQHPKDGTLIECVEADDAAPILQARGIYTPQRISGGSSNSDREREKVAMFETTFRRTLAIRILFGATYEALDLTELRLIAAGAFWRHDFDTQKLIVALWDDDAATLDRAATERMREEIELMVPADLHNFLRLVTLAPHIKVSTWQDKPTETPAPLLTLAERWGIDLEAVRKQATEDAAKGKKGKKKAVPA